MKVYEMKKSKNTLSNRTCDFCGCVIWINEDFYFVQSKLVDRIQTACIKCGDERK